MKEKSNKLTFLAGLSVVAIAFAAIGIDTSNRNSKAQTDYTISLNETNSPAANNVAVGSSSTIKTEYGNNITFRYSDCLGSDEYHVVINEGGSIKNSTKISGITSITLNSSADVQLRTSIDNTTWSTYTAISNGSSNIDACNYIEIAPVSGSASVEFSLNYSCEAATPGKTYNPADYYDGYYADIVSWENGEDLRQQLNVLINTGKNELKYADSNWDSNTDADHIQDNYFYVDALYSEEHILSASTNRGWQREHAWCASLMTGTTTTEATKFLGRATDFHNLFAGESAGNMSRGNKNYGVANKTDANYQDRTTNGGADGYSFDTKNFEPGNKDKGRVARAIFYMATCYMDEVLDTSSGITMKGLEVVDEYVDYVAGDNCLFEMGNKSTLIEWNDTIAVDRLEMQHNVSVQTHAHKGIVQNNRNPYVDYPELVDYVFGSKADKPGKLENIKPSVVDLGLTVENAKEHRYYTIKDAKTSYPTGGVFSSNSITVMDVKNDFTSSTYVGEISTSLDGYTFVENPGEKVTNEVTIGSETFTYEIIIEGMTACNHYSQFIKADTGITTACYGADQEITFGSDKWMVNVGADSGCAINNKNENGVPIGITIGSSTGGKQFQSMTLTSKSTYSIDKFYFSCTPANKSSSFTMKMYVGDELVKTISVPYTDGKTFTDFSADLTETKTGILKIEITGSNSLICHAIAYNVVD